MLCVDLFLNVELTWICTSIDWALKGKRGAGDRQARAGTNTGQEIFGSGAFKWYKWKTYHCSFVKLLYLQNNLALDVVPILPTDDLRQLNDKLAEVNTSKMSLQVKLDELEAAEVNIKVS